MSMSFGISKGHKGWDTAPVSVLRADTGDGSLFVILSDLSEYQRSIRDCKRGLRSIPAKEALREVEELRFTCLKDAKKYVVFMVENVVPGSQFLIDPHEWSWPRVTGRFMSVSMPYIKPSKGKARKIRTNRPNPYPRVAG
jgi:hypothetical protein